MNVASTIYNYFLNIDTLGPAPGISNNGNSRYATMAGTFLSLFLYLLVFLVYRSDIEDVFRETNPKIVSERKPIIDEIQFNSSVSNLIFYEIRYLDLITLTFKTISKANHPKLEIRNVHFNTSDYFPNRIPDVNNNNSNSYLESCTSNNIFDDFNKYSGSINLNREQIKIKQDDALCYPKHVDLPILTSLEDNYSIVAFFDYKQLINLANLYKTNVMMIVVNSLEINLTPNNSTDPFKLLWKENWIPINFDKVRMTYLHLETYKGNKDLTKFIVSPKIKPVTHYFIETVEDRLEFNNYHQYPEEYYFLDSVISLMITNNQRITEEFLYYKSLDGVLGNIGGL